MSGRKFRAGRPSLNGVPLTVVERVERHRGKRVRYEFCIDHDLHMEIEAFQKQHIPGSRRRTETLVLLLKKGLLLLESNKEAAATEQSG